ncbi:VacJ family lipoprotein [Pelagibius sp. Alg239-R121]|uniref:MlaA family lipoprotein n=1 Tax=Pelagibius sp. Alg239-R121 TaxID=2993448 RepID=UPI0024A7A058|nr:VacJ family lipoprotein [Pelagibius sp. Alg239-R121]
MVKLFFSHVSGKMLGALAILLVVSGCASAPKNTDDQWAQSDGTVSASEPSDNDPIELLNRFVFAFNDALDVTLFQPASALYRFALPEEVRDSVRNFMRNISTPVILANDLLQGEWERAEATTTRFFVNSTIGVAGLFDVAKDMGYDYHDEDFGQTLATYGTGEGAYLVLPLVGPSSLRDGAGLIVDSLLDPLTYILSTEAAIARRGISSVDTRSRNIELVEEIKRDSIDYYARVRSLYRQRRENEISNGVEEDDFLRPGLTFLEQGTGNAQLGFVPRTAPLSE